MKQTRQHSTKGELVPLLATQMLSSDAQVWSLNYGCPLLSNIATLVYLAATLLLPEAAAGGASCSLDSALPLDLFIKAAAKRGLEGVVRTLLS